MKSKLKLVEAFKQGVGQRLAVKERKFVGTIHRKSQQSSDRARNLTRRYSTLDNAVSRMTEFFIRNGYVGDVCELYHADTGKQLGTIRMSANGTLTAKWIWESRDA